jgi:DNA polymerase III delta prime subunit
VYIILCTTEPESLINTIRTRCSAYEVSSLEKGTLYKLIKGVSKKEGVEVDSEVLKLIAKRSDGSARKALVYLQQVIGVDDPQDAMQIIKDATVSEVNAKNICKILLEVGQLRQKWSRMAPLLRAVTGDPESLRYAVLGYLGAVMLNQPNDRLAEMVMIFSDSWMYNKRAGMISSMYLACKL